MKAIVTLITFIFSQFLFAGDSLIFIIRVDDIQSRNTTMIPRSIFHFEEAVQQRGGKVTWGVIPHRLIETQNINGILQQELRESITRGHEISLHGYNHICPNCGSSSHEMFCSAQNYHFPYSQQKDSLILGLNILSDSINVIPDSFIPPGHQQDSTTFRVLLDLGINILSSNGPQKDFIYKELFNLKANNEYTWQLTQEQYQVNLTNALSNIRAAGIMNGYYMLLFHDPFIRRGYNNGIVVEWIGELLDSLNIEYGPNIKYKTLTEAALLFRDKLTSNIAEEIPLPDKFELLQNYPNPFNPSTTIKWKMPVESFVTLKVYDILGKEVAMLVNEYRQAGISEALFDGSELNSGIYFYTINAGSFAKSNKMLLLK